MKTRTFVAIGFLILVAGAAWWKLTRKDPHIRDEKAAGGPPGMPSLKAADIDEFEVIEKDKPKVVLKKDGGEWKVVEPVKARADQKNVETTLSTLEKAKIRDVVAESAASYESLGVRDEDVLEVTPKKGGQPLVTLLISKSGKQVRFKGKPEVWEVEDLSRFVFSRDIKMWRDREIVHLDRDQIADLEASWPDGKKVAAHREPPPPPPAEEDPSKPKPPPGPDKWTVTAGADLIGGPLDETVPAGMSATMSRMDASDFADDATLGSAGLEKPRLTLTATLKDGTKKDVMLGREDGQDVFVKRSDSPMIWRIRKAAADGLLKDPLNWRDKTLAKLDAKDVTKIEIVKDQTKLAFDRVDDKTWKMTAPSDLPDLDSGKVQGLASGFQNLRAQSIVDAQDPAKTGLAKPTGTITVTAKSGTVTVTVGALVDKNYFVKVTGRPEVFTLNEFTVGRYFKGQADFKKPVPQPGGGAKAAHPPAGMMGRMPPPP